MSEVLLSISVPFYNNKKLFYEWLDYILELDDDRFDVCITDDCSTDGSYKPLAQYNDPRVRLFKNDTNIGAANFIRCLYNSDGKYAVFMIARDWVLKEGLLQLLDFLEECNEDFSLMRCKDISHKPNGNLAIYKSIADRYSQNPVAIHPSGTIYNVSKIKKYPQEEYFKYNQENFPAFFPETFLQRDILQDGCFIKYSIPLYRNGSNRVKEKSRYAVTEITRWYWYPSCELQFFDAVLEQLSKLNINDSDRPAILATYRNEMFQRIARYKEYAYNPYNEGHPYHYNFKPRWVTTAEYLYWVYKFRKLGDTAFKDNKALLRVWKAKPIYFYLLCIKKSLAFDINFIKALVNKTHRHP